MNNSNIENVSSLWNISDVMRFAKVKTRNTVYSCIEDGLPFIKFRRSIRFDPEKTKAFFMQKIKVN